MTIDDKKRTLSVKEVAGILRLDERRTRDLAEARKIPGAIKPDGLKKWIFSRKAFEKYLGVKLEDL